jgi:hypothetical protein
LAAPLNQSGFFSLSTRLLSPVKRWVGGDGSFVTVIGFTGIVASFLPQVEEDNTPRQMDAADERLL